MLRRPSAGRALWPLDSDGPPRTRLGRRLFRAMGISSRFRGPPTAGDSNLYRAAGGNCAHAARPFPHLHVSWIVAVVPRAGLLRYEAGRELARIRKILPQMRRRDRSAPDRWRRVFYLEPLAEPDQHPGDGFLAPVFIGLASPVAIPQSAIVPRASSPHPYKR